MSDISVAQLFLLAAVALIMLGSGRYFRRVTREGQHLLAKLRGELIGRMPVFSAETTRAREAEFIRDRLRTQWSWTATLVVAAVAGATIWCLAR